MRDTDTHTRDQYEWHLRRLETIGADFAAGKLTVAEKRRAIADENATYYGPSDRLAQVVAQLPAPDFGIMHATPADPTPHAARIRSELGWPA